jgi:hypothetical protein
MIDPPPIARLTDIVDAIALIFAEMEAYRSPRSRRTGASNGLLSVVSKSSRKPAAT